MIPKFLKRKIMKASYSVILCLLPAACTQPVMQEKGIIYDATMNTVTIITENRDTLSFCTADADRSQSQGLLLGDTLDVSFRGKYRQGMPANSLVLYPAQQTRSYEGVLPAASSPGIVYSLTLRSPEHSGDGTFRLALTYLEAENGKDITFIYNGKRLTLRGIPGNNDATVWQLISDDGTIFNFLVEEENTLTLLNDRCEKNETRLNYSLKRIR